MAGMAVVVAKVEAAIVVAVVAAAPVVRAGKLIELLTRFVRVNSGRARSITGLKPCIVFQLVGIR